MERRTFVKGAFGLVAFVVGAGIYFDATRESGPREMEFTTSDAIADDVAVGPAMVAGISLREQKPGEFAGYYGDTHLFNVDGTGAELIQMADGGMTIDEISGATSVPVDPADVASFFVSLGQSGYLRNKVLVNLTQTVV